MRNITAYLVWSMIKNSVYPEKRECAVKLGKQMILMGFTSSSIETNFGELGYLHLQRSKDKFEVLTRPNQFVDFRLKQKSFWQKLVDFV